MRVPLPHSTLFRQTDKPKFEISAESLHPNLKSHASPSLRIQCPRQAGKGRYRHDSTKTHPPPRPSSDRGGGSPLPLGAWKQYPVGQGKKELFSPTDRQSERPCDPYSLGRSGHKRPVFPDGRRRGLGGDSGDRPGGAAGLPHLHPVGVRLRGGLRAAFGGVRTGNLSGTAP